jgi:PAS domain S-box-containing protein
MGGTSAPQPAAALGRDSVRVAVLRRRQEPPAPWEAGLADSSLVVVDPYALSQDDRDVVQRASCIATSGEAPDAVERIRQGLRVNGAVQPIIVVDEDGIPRVQRSVLFTPGLGEVWIVSPREVDHALLRRAAEVTRKRGHFRRTRDRIGLDLSAIESSLPRQAMISDAYLAALLDATPDPIASIDPSGAVISWNPGAERVLGYSRREAVGRRMQELISPPDEPPIESLGSGSTHSPVRTDVRFRRKDGSVGEGELIVLPVEAAGHQVRAVILRDLTADRQARQELERHAAMLARQKDELEQQADALTKANEELQAVTQDLRRASSSRSRFYAAMSHELRTPINAIIGYQDLILAGTYGPLEGDQRHAIERAHRAARHLVELVNDVLDLAKIEAGRLELEIEDASFPMLIENLLDTVQGLVDHHGTEIRVVGEGAHSIRTDPRRLRQVLLNLLSNAIKFGEGNPVEVRWQRLDDGGVSIAVVDEGVGISADDLDTIFEEFTQIGPASPAGTGLGLAISKNLARLLGGSLTATSEPGVGSTFVLTIPAEWKPTKPPADGEVAGGS